MGVQVFPEVPAFSSFGYIPRNAITETYDNSMFNFFEKLSVCFLKLQPYVTFLPTMCKGFNFSTVLSTLVIFWCVCVCVCEFDNNHSNGIQYYFTVVLICPND